MCAAYYSTLKLILLCLQSDFYCSVDRVCDSVLNCNYLCLRILVHVFVFY